MPTTLAHVHHQHHVPWSLIIALAVAFLIVVIIALAPVITLPGPSLIPVTGNQASARELFRQEELTLYYNRVPSSMGSDSFYEFRMGEWPSAPVDARYEFRRGEWFGN